MSKKNCIIKTDLTIDYLIPMARKDNYKIVDIVRSRICKNENGKLTFEAVENKDKYDVHSFYDEYFQWLLYTKYIVIFDENI